MTLNEILQKLPFESSVGIWNIDNKRAKCPTPQTYQKVKNITWRKLRNIIDYEVLVICPNEKGLLIKVYDKTRLEESLSEHNIARIIKEAKK